MGKLSDVASDEGLDTRGIQHGALIAAFVWRWYARRPARALASRLRAYCTLAAA